MNKRKLKIFQIGIGFGMCISLLFLSRMLSFAEMTVGSDNIEALTDDEFTWNSECTAAGGICLISLTSHIRGISLAD